MGRDFIEEKAHRMAQDLDQGGGELVAEKLRQDSIRLPETEFARLVNLTRDYERPGVGDDLQSRPVQGGEVITVQKYLGQDRRGNDVVRSLPAGEIDFSNIYEEQNRGGRDSRRGNRDGIDPKDVAIGAVIGFGIGKIIEHHNDKKDERRRDDRRHDERRYPHR